MMYYDIESGELVSQEQLYIEYREKLERRELDDCVTFDDFIRISMTDEGGTLENWFTDYPKNDVWFAVLASEFDTNYGLGDTDIRKALELVDRFIAGKAYIATIKRCMRIDVRRVK